MSSTVKMLREHLAREQRQPMTRIESALHGYLIALCDVLRPLGPDGKHRDRHTPLCGCDDVADQTRPTGDQSGSRAHVQEVTPLDLDAIEARAAAATPGPWRTEHDESGEHRLYVDEPRTDLGCGGRTVTQWLTAKNAEFVAHVREDVPALVAEVRRLAAALAEAEAALAEVKALAESIENEDDEAWSFRVAGRIRDALLRAEQAGHPA